jgi:asparagine synthase (glutamine-hydrolysing)
MCGICGVLSLGGGEPPALRLIEAMTSKLAHRGPNDSDVWIEGPVGLGHRRLAVLDLSRAGRQPMANEDGSVRITYNGEVYNFRELEQQHKLRERGHRIVSRSDTETLVHLYEELGLGMLPELNGMFAFALWDARSRELHLARDRFGIKPLFYQQDTRVFRFGSEIKAILADPAVPRRPDRQALHDFLSFNYIPGEQTAFEGIREIPPAHVLTVRPDGTTELRRWWKLAWDLDASIDEPTAVARVRDLLGRSVDRRLISDVPVGIMLSGGMDSSVLAALARERITGPLRTYAIGFDDPSFDESSDAEAVARHLGAEHRRVTITPAKARAAMLECLDKLDEPYADGSAIPTWYLAQLARPDVTVLLSGEGGDEVFAGYDTYAAFKAARWARRVPRLVRNGLLRPLAGLLPVSHRKLSLEFKLKRFLGGLDLPLEEGHLWWRLVLGEAAKRSIYARGAMGDVNLEPSLRHFLRASNESGADEPLARLQAIDSAVFLPDDLMVKNDRMTMAHGMEARVPFTDVELAEFLAKVPSRVKYPGGDRKRLLKRAFGVALPSTTARKKKIGLELPYSRWFTGEWSGLLRTVLAPERVAATGLLAPASTTRLADDHVARKADNGRALWALIQYVLWHEKAIQDRLDRDV